MLDNFSTGRRENIEELKKQFDGNRLEVLEGDVRDGSRVEEAVRGVEFIFHEAAFVSVPQSMDEPQNCFDVNIMGTSQLFDVARKAGVRRAAVASSAAVYGESAVAVGRVRLSSRCRRMPSSKRVKEMYAELFTGSFDFEVVPLRYFNVYGPRSAPDSMYAAAVPIFACRLLDGEARHHFRRWRADPRPDQRPGRGASQPGCIRASPLRRGRSSTSAPGLETRLLDLLDAMYELLPNAPMHEFRPLCPAISTVRWGVRELPRRMGFRAQASWQMA